ncbi:MAG TPA: transglutaminase-like domain-containing protein, partial [Myxococcota bacterium]|nr:transglutaminase-like domain-containing protein [Myxococcota bacterium]
MLSLLPLLAALLFHAVATGRLALVLPLIAALLLAKNNGWTLKYGTLQAWGVALLGLAAGLGLNELWPYPAGLFPAWGLSAVAAACVLLSVWLWTCQEFIAAWGVAFLVVVLSGHAEMRREMVPAGGLLVLSLGYSLLRPLAMRKLPRIAVLVVVTGLGTLLLGTQLRAAEGIVARLVVQYMTGELFAAGLGSSFRVPLNAQSSVSPSDRVVMEVSGATPSRLRNAVLDQFDGDQWSSSGLIQAEVPVEAGRGGRQTRLDFRQSFRQVIPAPPGIFEVDRRVARRSNGGLVLGMVSWGESRRLEGGDMEIRDLPGPETLVLPDDLRQALLPFVAELMGREFFWMEEGEEALSPLLEEQSGVRAEGERLERYFLSNFRYSLDTDLRGEEHPIVVLLRERRPAYCIYFASAMVALLRADGQHARMVGGYLLEPPNALSGATLVRERNAHAWVELWIPEEQRWATFDPTPMQAAEAPPSWLDTLREAMAEELAWQLLALTTHPAERVQALLLSPPSLGILGLAMLWALYERIAAREKAEAVWKVKNKKSLSILPLYRRYQKALGRVGI